jgi:hypothetical protein
MGEPDEELRDDKFVVVTPDEPAPVKDKGAVATDGHGGAPRREFLETRERLSAVEQQVAQNGEIVERVETKVDTLHDDLETVEENALDEEYFENRYKANIEKNSDVVTLLVWGGGVLLAVLGSIATLYSTGLL